MTQPPCAFRLTETLMVSRHPRYPLYVVSKGRYGKEGLTPRFLMKDGVPFHLVVEPQEADHYGVAFGPERVLALPFSNLGQGSIPARNWIWEHARAAGYARHWILDDNIAWISRYYRGRRIRCDAGVALAAVEDFSDRYENLAISGLNYEMFLIPGSRYPPFHLNCHVYSCFLIRNDLPYRWRGRYNEDADLCLQVLADGWCTALINAFLIWKKWTMKMQGGNTDQLYQGDGRLKMARSLERMWPGVVRVDRRWQRPQHVVKDSWKRFDTPLRLKPDVDLAALPAVNEYGMKLVQVAPTVKSAALRQLLAAQEQGAATT
jgi:hypothetical protein